MAELDLAFLEQHASITSGEIEERVFLMDVEGGSCFALLTRPAVPKDLGFVVCHSYGLELLTLRRTERAVARALAGMGYPVLSFHRRGYGDSTGSLEDATLEWHLDDVHAAAARLSAETGTSKLGLIGARFGGLIAGLVARDGGVERLLLMNPSLRGTAYFKEAIREMHMVHVAIKEGGSRRSMSDLIQGLNDDGMIDVLGHPIYRHLHQALEGIDLSSDMGSFGGDALVFQVSKGSTVQRELEALAALIRVRGGSCRIHVVREPPGARFGGAAFVTMGDPNVRVDVQEPIVDEIARVSKEWMSS
jgi:pimeloyl-ACP methyl ester carboxylesterase